MMKHLPKSKVEIELTIEWKEWEKFIAPAVAEISAEFKFSGFRPGKAPRNLVEQKVGKEMILSHAAEKAISKNYSDFVSREKLAVVGGPKVEIEKISEREDLVFTATVAVMPEVKIDDKYKDAIKKINAQYQKKTTEVSDDEITLELEKIANSRVKLVTVRRAVASNELLTALPWHD